MHCRGRLLSPLSRLPDSYRGRHGGGRRVSDHALERRVRVRRIARQAVSATPRSSRPTALCSRSWRTKAAGESSQLYVRRLDRLQATPLAGTDGAEGPFFAPDGQWIGFFAGGKLKKIAVTGGAVVPLCDVR